MNQDRTGNLQDFDGLANPAGTEHASRPEQASLASGGEASSRKPAGQMLSKSAIQRAYRLYAPFYDLLFGPVLHEGRSALASAVDSSARSLLEIGVGTGLALPRYPRHLEVVGVDISINMLWRAQKYAVRREAGKTQLLCADAEQLPFRDDTFDCVTLPYVLSVTPNPQQMLRELRRVCRPGGQVLILNHFSGAGPWARFEGILAKFADRIGFNSLLPMDVLSHPDWSCTLVRNVNILGLSKLVTFRNESPA